ncbi:rRNA biogenesis protein rrp36-like [Miscanthus floridulus]|uniref:rRNA biogenesis protein rrp36-like n=1 Tax=Miscanthus floridulus TaxID=154761 RepID=UPI0034591546
MMLRLFEDLKKPLPADLMNRLANIDARRHQVSASSHVSTNPLEILTSADIVDTNVDDDDYYDEMNDSNSYDDDNHSSDDFDEDDGSDDISGSEDADMNSGNEEDNINEEDDSDDNEDDINDN